VVAFYLQDKGSKIRGKGAKENDATSFCALKYLRRSDLEGFGLQVGLVYTPQVNKNNQNV
jgi:hypothetical protein